MSFGFGPAGGFVARRRRSSRDMSFGFSVKPGRLVGCWSLKRFIFSLDSTLCYRKHCCQEKSCVSIKKGVRLFWMSKVENGNPAAIALVKVRWDGTTAKDRSEHARMMAEERWAAYYAAN